ncbi:MAG: hypothetical protein EZS28_046643 [Streblomastix strix]|uniref:Uncharacterized protein n=1 Tax=Streblomastix strix TaxID=222440 RepID=A0A5J4TJ89_9EUKA|nr:MAG: hypothetical protein EZS28_046643 [Streblomastix strix]
MEKSNEYLSHRLDNTRCLLDDWMIILLLFEMLLREKLIFGHRVVLEYTNFIRFFINSDESLKIRNLNNPRIWDIDYKITKLISNEIVHGHMRRIWTTAVIDNDDKYVYLGSIAGDIVAFDIQNYYLKHFGAVKDKDQLYSYISQLEFQDLNLHFIYQNEFTLEICF